MKDMIGLRHTGGQKPCGKLAIWYETNEIPEQGRILGDYAEFLDGTKPKAGDHVRCGSCGYFLSAFMESGELSLSSPKSQQKSEDQ